MSRTSNTKPPRLASWLLDLFTPPSESESIPGDLIEEFPTAVSTLGRGAARRWYWRQAVKTIAHLISRELHTAPWTIAATAVGGYLLLMGAVRSVDMATGAFLGNFQVYYYVRPRFVWWIYAVGVDRVICPMLIGWMAASISRRTEMATAATLSSMAAVIGFPLQLEGGLLWLVYSTVFLDKAWPDHPTVSSYILAFYAMLGLLPPIALFVGAVIRRKSLSTGRPPIAA